MLPFDNKQCDKHPLEDYSQWLSERKQMNETNVDSNQTKAHHMFAHVSLVFVSAGSTDTLSQMLYIC